MGTTRIVMVGCGHMGSAIVRGLLGGHGVPDSTDVVVVESDAARRAELAADGRFAVSAKLQVAEGDLIVLAIPPQAFPQFSESVRGAISSTTAVLSVMAGLPAAHIGESLGTTQVVRAIPNTPSEVFQGMSVYYADAGVSEHAVARADALLRSVGGVLRVDTEELVDDATAICGGGPAFVSYIVDAFCDFAVSRGFTEASGRDMAVRVFGGTAALIATSGRSPTQLCLEVMTKGGTTERGIAVFESAELKDVLLAALGASAERSRELAAVPSVAVRREETR